MSNLDAEFQGTLSGTKSGHRFARVAGPLGAGLLAGLCVFGASGNARAASGSRLALDLDYTKAIDEPFAGSGKGIGVRYGYKLDLIAIGLTPEVGVAYHTFSGAASAKFTRGFAGARLSLGKTIEPGAYAHVGYGHLGVDPSGGRSAMALDAGVTLDLTLIPVLDLGAHAGYSGLLKSNDSSAFDTYVLGLHAAFAF